jgi:hypothetical protein
MSVYVYSIRADTTVTYKSSATGNISLDRVNDKESFRGGVAGPAAGNQKVTGLTPEM